MNCIVAWRPAPKAEPTQDDTEKGEQRRKTKHVEDECQENERCGNYGGWNGGDSLLPCGTGEREKTLTCGSF